MSLGLNELRVHYMDGNKGSILEVIATIIFFILTPVVNNRTFSWLRIG